jgi:hypothetical protein
VLRGRVGRKRGEFPKAALNWGANSDIMPPNALSNAVGRSIHEEFSLYLE